MIVTWLMLLLGYLIGSFPVGVIVAMLSGIEDLTKRGSGNIGATNVARFLGLRYFFIVFFLDALKAFVFLKTFMIMARPDPLLLGIAWLVVVIGNGYSIFLRFKGGKGVSTLFGLALASIAYPAFYCAAVWLLVLAVIRVVGIASVLAVSVLPIAAYLYGEPSVFVVCISLCVMWCWWRHYENIKKFFGIRVPTTNS